MGYAADGGTASSVADDEGFRASIIRKRHSLFGSRNHESTSSLNLHQHTPATSPAAEHHNTIIADRDPIGDSRRRSFFGGRFTFGGKKEEQPRTRESLLLPPPPALEASPVQHLRADPSVTEDDYYRNHTKSTISPPFHFQHVTHTKKKHLPALDSVDEKILNREFAATSTSQAPRGHLKGIQADDLSANPEAMGLIRGSGDMPKAPSRADKAKSMAPEKAARSSRYEDITALPGFGKPKRSLSTKTKRDEWGSLLGLGKSSPTEGPTKARADTYNALLGIKEDKEANDAEEPAEDMFFMGFPSLTQKQSVASTTTSRPSMDESKRLSGSGRAQKSETSLRRDVTSLLRFKDRSMSESAAAAPKAKREEVNALLGISEEKSKRQSKVDEKKKEEVHALLGLSTPKPKKFEPMAPPAPPRPRRSDEDLKLRNTIVPAAPSPLLPPPDRPRRDSKDVEHLREMGFGQLLYRENSNESRQGHALRRETTNESRPSLNLQRQNSSSSPRAPPMRRQSSNDSRHSQPMQQQNSNDSRIERPLYRQDSNILPSPVHPQDSNNFHHIPTSPSFSQHSPRVALDEEAPSPVGGPEDFARAQQVVYRSRKPLPPIPRMLNISPEGRNVEYQSRSLQTVNELGETNAPLRTPTEPTLSPRSPNHTRSPFSKSMRSPELTGPSIPDDDRWEREIDFLYSKQMEATNEFDWDNASIMTPQNRLSVREPEKRLSLNIPSDSMPGASRLSKKFSEDSLRASRYMPAALNIQPQHRVYAAKPMSPVDEYTAGGARASPEIRVMDANDHRQEVSYPEELHMHGYESIAAGYLSDPESNSERSQHRKSNSYSSWESRPSVAKEAARYSTASINNVPELTFTRRPKQPITSIPGYNPSQESQASNPMHDYAAFTRGPYANSIYETTPGEYVSARRTESISQPLLRVAAARSSRDAAQQESHRWSRNMQNSPASPYAQSQPSGWI